MHNLDGLTLHFDGYYNDAFLYSHYLYLVDDEDITVINFIDLIEDIAPIDPDQRILFRYAFINNSFFYKADSDFYEFFNMPTIKKFIRSAFDKIGDMKIEKNTIEKHIKSRIKHDHPGVLHFEIYKNNVFISNESGTFAYKILDKPKLMRKCHIFEYPSVHIGALTGDTIYCSCVENGFNIVSFDHIKQKNHSLSVKAINNIDKKAVNIDSIYRDFILRDVDNKYYYEFDTLWGSGMDLSNVTPEERLDSFQTLSDNSAFSNSSFVSAAGNRIINFSNNDIELLKMDYNSRTNVITDQAKEQKFYFNPINRWKSPYYSNESPVYSGFQTVFGLVLDTDEGTFVIDDNEDDKKILNKRNISIGENVKVRHFYRSVNYSHLVINIKNESIEFFSDLSDYFFPKEKKMIRKSIARAQAMNSIYL